MHPTNDGSTAAAAAALTTSLDLCARIPIPVDGLEVTRCRRSRPIDRLFFLTPNPLLAPPRAGVMEPRAVARQRPDVFNGITRNQWPIIFQGPLLSLPLSLSLSLSPSLSSRLVVGLDRARNCAPRDSGFRGARIRSMRDRARMRLTRRRRNVSSLIIM